MIKTLRAKLKVIYGILSCRGCVVVYVDDRELSFQIFNTPLEQVALMCDQTADMAELILAQQESETLGEQLIRNINRN